MKVTANLFINRDGSLRITKKDPSAYATELAVQLVIDVPDIFFKRPMPKVELEIPEEYLVNPDTEVVAKWVSHDIAEALKIDVKAVEDGMVAMLKADKEKRDAKSK